MDGEVDGWMNVWMDGRTDGQRWMDGWTFKTNVNLSSSNEGVWKEVSSGTQKSTQQRNNGNTASSTGNDDLLPQNVS